MKTFLLASLKTIVFFFAFFIIQNTNAQLTVSTLAGSGAIGITNGTGTLSQFHNPTGIAIALDGTIYVADNQNNCIRKITTAGIVSTFAGTGVAGLVNGTLTTAQFFHPTGLTIDLQGTIFVTDLLNSCIRKITTDGVVSTFAGSGIIGFLDGPGTTARFNSPYGITVDATGNVYVADQSNHRIRKITPAGEVTTIAGSTMGYIDGAGTSAQFKYPTGVILDATGNLIVADTQNNRIRKITPTGAVTTLAGSAQGFADGNGAGAQFYWPHGLAFNANGALIVTDEKNNRVRKITTTGVVSTLAGTGIAGYANGTATVAQFYSPIGIAVAPDGTIYITDANNQRIRKFTGTLATTDYQLENQVSVFPNPTSGLLTISCSKEIMAVSVLNLLGQTVLTQTNKTLEVQLDLSSLTDGAYIVKMVSEGKTKTFKVMKGL